MEATLTAYLIHLPNRRRCQGQKRADTWRRLWRGHVSCLNPPLQWADTSSAISRLCISIVWAWTAWNDASHWFFPSFDSSEDVKVLSLLDTVVQF